MSVLGCHGIFEDIFLWCLLDSKMAFEAAGPTHMGIYTGSRNLFYGSIIWFPVAALRAPCIPKIYLNISGSAFLCDGPAVAVPKSVID